MKQYLYRVLLLSSVCASSLYAQGIQADQKKAMTPQESLASFKLADGFVAELVVSEEHGLINPIDITFDDSGRLWTQTAKMYPLDPVTGIGFGTAMRMMKDPKMKNDPRFVKMRDMYQLKVKGKDQILIIDDLSKKQQGKMRVWADGLTIPQSIMPYKDGCYVAHGSELFFLEDKNKDGKQDGMTPVLTGFGFFDTHTMAHSIVRGPGGWMYFSHGAINSGKVKAVKSGVEQEITYSKNARFSIDGEQLELVNAGLQNIWGYQLLANGQWYGTEANDLGWSVTPMEPQTGFKGIGGDKIRSYQPLFPPPNDFRVGRTGISGLAFSEDGKQGFPTEWKNVAFLANPLTQSINAVHIVRNPDGTVTSKHLPDLLKAKDEWFRPVNIEFGPDGFLYVVDWYNKIISHNEVTTDHPDRDRKHGRIWRIRHKSQKPLSIPNVAKASNNDLIKHIKGETIWEKRAAWHQIVDRQAQELAPALVNLLNDDSLDKRTKITALWSLEGIKAYDVDTLKQLLASKDADVRREAVRSLSSFNISADQVAKLVSDLVEDKNAMVRSQVLRTLDEIHQASPATISLLVNSCKPAAPDATLGGNYERNFERFLARKALERYPNELKTFLAGDAGIKLPAENILWAIQALPEKDRTEIFVSIWNKASQGEIDPNTFAAITKMLRVPAVRKAVEASFKKNRDKYIQLGLKHLKIIDGPALADMYKPYISSLLGSGDSSKVKEGLDLVYKFHSPAFSTQLRGIFKKLPSNLKNRAMTAISYDPKVDGGFFRSVLYDDTNSKTTRIQALGTLALKNKNQAMQDLKKFIAHLSDSDKTQLVTKLSTTRQGCELLLNLWQQSYLENNHWSYNSAHQAKEFSAKDWRAQKVFQEASKVEITAEKARKVKIKQYSKEIPKLTPNAAVGQGMFQACAVCHNTKEGGIKVAPPIGGAGNGNISHLLTAIMNPDEAVEGAYALYQVVRKDGTSVEGYLAKSDKNGVTIGHTGGAGTFIARSQVLREGNVNKRSFMTNGFSELPAQTLADLIEYLKKPNP